MRSGSAVVAVLLLGACLAALADDTTKVVPQAIPEGAAETSKFVLMLQIRSEITISRGSNV